MATLIHTKYTKANSLRDINITVYMFTISVNKYSCFDRRWENMTQTKNVKNVYICVCVWARLIHLINIKLCFETREKRGHTARKVKQGRILF